MKPIKALGVLAALGGLLVTLNLGGVAGCGDDNGGGGGGGGTATEERAAGLSAFTGLSSFASDNSDDAALKVAALALKAKHQATDICSEGSFSVTPTGLTFDNCTDTEGNVIDGTISIDADTDGTEPFISTISFENVSFADVDCGTFTIDGDSVVSVFLDGSGTIDYGLNISGPGGDFSFDCTLSLDYTCPDFVAECGGFTESEICNGDEFRGDISCE